MNQQSATRPLRVFLCHSSGDKPAVRNLYQRLKEDGFQPWLDEEDLLPGKDWPFEIPRAVKAADVVIVCLSSEAVIKRGYIQREISLALDTADEQPEGSIFVIPLRLEECEIPPRLSRWQWVDHFQADGYQRLIRSLNTLSTGPVSSPNESRAPARATFPQSDSASEQHAPVKNVPALSKFSFPLGLCVAALSAAMAIFIFSHYYHSRSAPKNSPELPAAHNPERRAQPSNKVSPISFREFGEYIHDNAHTRIQQDDFLKHLLGSRVTWSGWVGEVSDFPDKQISVLLMPEINSSSRLAFLRFSQADRSSLAALSFNQKITATCTMASFDSHAQLRDCKLEKIWPKN